MLHGKETTLLVQVLKLKEQMCEAEKEIKRLLLERSDGVSSSSPTTSSLSMEAVMDRPFLGEFGFDDTTFYGPAQGWEWANNL